MEFKYTKHQVARGTMADAIYGNEYYLIKSCQNLYLTYQIKLLVYMAHSEGGKVIIKVNSNCKISKKLKKFQKENKKHLKIEER